MSNNSLHKTNIPMSSDIISEEVSKGTTWLDIFREYEPDITEENVEHGFREYNSPFRVYVKK